MKITPSVSWVAANVASLRPVSQVAWPPGRANGRSSALPGKGASYGASRASEGGFTLPEVSLSMAIFVVLAGAIIAMNLFGITISELIVPRVAANLEATPLSLRMTEEIASAKEVRVGTGDELGFTAVTPGALQRGNALELYLTNDLSQWIRYYHDPASQELRRETSAGGDTTVIFQAVTNTFIFTGEAFDGSVLTNRPWTMAVGITLQFAALEGTDTPVGDDLAYTGFQFRARAVRRPK